MDLAYQQAWNFGKLQGIWWPFKAYWTNVVKQHIWHRVPSLAFQSKSLWFLLEKKSIFVIVPGQGLPSHNLLPFQRILKASQQPFRIEKLLIRARLNLWKDNQRLLMSQLMYMGIETQVHSLLLSRLVVHNCKACNIFLEAWKTKVYFCWGFCCHWNWQLYTLTPATCLRTESWTLQRKRSNTQVSKMPGMRFLQSSLWAHLRSHLCNDEHKSVLESLHQALVYGGLDKAVAC